MDNREKEVKKRCKKCKAFIEAKYELCSICNEKYNNEIVVINKYDDVEKTVDFYKLKLIEKFQSHNEVVLSFIKKYADIANKVIEETKHMGFQEDKRKIKKVKSKNPPYREVEYIKSPLVLIPAVRALKKDRRWY